VVRFTNIAAYRFTPLRDLGPKRGRLLELCRNLKLRGTILLSSEGINLFVAGERPAIDTFLAELRSWPGLESLDPKFSESDDHPFHRMLVRIKKEIIAFGIEGIAPGRHTSPKLPPHKLLEWLDEGKPVVLLDTRNDYEVKLGTFRNALTLNLQHFRDFPKAVRELPPPLKEQPIVMFCTGGIRCEKAGPFMESQGFKQIYQLEGGILKYFEECGARHYEGECFVFDQRVGVDPQLRETDSALCFTCLTPLTAQEQQDPRYRPGHSCPHCFRTPAQQLAETLARRHERIRQASNPLPGSIPYDNDLPLTIPEEADGKPLLDTFTAIVRSLSREQWKTEFHLGRILNADKDPVTADHAPRAGEYFFRRIPKVTEPSVNADIRILHEDEALIVVNKPAPLPMHPGGRFNRNTLQYLLHAAYDPERPRPAHRLDANTTGLVLLTRTRHFAARLQPQFAKGQVRKLYLVKVRGVPAQDWFECDAPISAEPGEAGSRTIDWSNGLPSRTQFRVLRGFPDGTTLLEASPLTGRTNQIRLHLWHLGLPVCGDTLYGPQRAGVMTAVLGLSDAPLCLHARSISFTHPLTRQVVEFTAATPAWADP